MLVSHYNKMTRATRPLFVFENDKDKVITCLFFDGDGSFCLTTLSPLRMYHRSVSNSVIVLSTSIHIRTCGV